MDVPDDIKRLLAEAVASLAERNRLERERLEQGREMMRLREREVALQEEQAREYLAALDQSKKSHEQYQQAVDRRRKAFERAWQGLCIALLTVLAVAAIMTLLSR